MVCLENVFLDSKVLGVLEAAPPAAGGRGGEVGLHAGHLLQIQTRFLLFGTRILEPNLYNALGQADIIAKRLTLGHCWCFVAFKNTFHHLYLNI